MLLVFVADFSNAVHCRDKLLIQILLQKKNEKETISNRRKTEKTQQCELDFFLLQYNIFQKHSNK